MKEVFIFEFKKIYKSRVTLLALGLIIIGFTFFVFRYSDINNSLRVNSLNIIDNNIDEINKNIKELNEDINKDIVDYLKEQIKLLDDQKVYIINNDNINYIDSEIEYNNIQLKLMELNYISDKNINNIIDKINEYEELKRLNINPIIKEYSMEGYNFLRLSMNAPITILITLLVVIISSNSISGEFENKTYKILFWQPISKVKIIVAKFLAIFISCIINIYSILFGFFIILGIKNGFGNYNYPIKIMLNGNFEFIGISKFISIELLFLIVYILFLCIFTIMTSLIIKQISTSISICSILSLIIYIIIFKLEFVKNIYRYIPFTFMELSSLLMGDIAIKSNNFTNNIINCTIYTYILIIIFSLVNIFIINKKYI